MRASCWCLIHAAGSRTWHGGGVGEFAVYWHEVEDDKKAISQNPMEANKSFTDWSFSTKNYKENKDLGAFLRR